ncbi:unnamed protein product [Clonostachys rhizophaga]|uniref:Fungal-type protein kinase domain-containing protein n=1 Tax=Clonostachys rhizophaga TaxID=160324 RepID=A0A9N9YJG0_9HYPO|nr:unnamed protein product [Clonostachys rhizophaga]
MADLTEEELGIIKLSPLGDSLNAIREALCDAQPDRSTNASQSEDNADAPDRPRLFLGAIRKLFSVLSASEASPFLASRTGRDSLGSDRISVRLRLLVVKDDFDLSHFRQIAQFIIDQAPDVDIWAAAITLIRAVTHTTPPPRISSPFGTPITNSSASQQGTEQTRREIEHRVFEEIRHCTYRAVEGFHEKYFEERRWSRRVKQIWQKAKEYYDGNSKRWKDLEGGANEDKVCNWWLGLQTNLVPTQRAAYFKSTPGNKVGSEASRQLDFLVKLKTAGSPGVKHDWRDVLVVGELKKSDQKNEGLWLQVGSAVWNVGVTFDIHEEPEKFIQVMCGYLVMSNDELGLDTFTKQKRNITSVALPVEARGKKRKHQLEMDPNPIAHQRAIVCRGTSCYLAKPTGATDFDRVVKFSWTSDKRRPEADLLDKANERGVRGIARVVGYQEEITSISNLRDGLIFSTPHKFRDIPRSAYTSFSQSQPPLGQSFYQFPGLSIASRGHSKRKPIDGSSPLPKRSLSSSQLARAGCGSNGVNYPIEKPEGTSLVQADHGLAPYGNRILRALAISPAGRSISQFKSVTELLESLLDAIKVHRSLFTDGKILHRDISENSIIITDPAKADGFRGMLIDLDLAEEVGKGLSGAQHRTGTVEFMAIEVLLGISHTYRHDLEAFFYVLIWLCARRGWALAGASRPPERSRLSRWYSEGYDDLAQTKRGDMDQNGLEFILRECPTVFACVKPLCRTIRDILFPYKDGLFTGTPKDPKVLYDPIIDAFEKAIVEVR